MSYCRFSSERFQCDVYCYADTSGGYTTHVAGRRRTEPAPEMDLAKMAGSQAECDRYNAAMAEWEKLPLLDIGLPHDGETFADPTLAALRERLVGLKALGYVVPESAFAAIDEEIAEGSPYDDE